MLFRRANGFLVDITPNQFNTDKEFRMALKQIHTPSSVKPIEGMKTGSAVELVKKAGLSTTA